VIDQSGARSCWQVSEATQSEAFPRKDWETTHCTLLRMIVSHDGEGVFSRAVALSLAAKADDEACFT